MIKEIEIHKYRKLKNLKFNFEPSVNVISGTNGTCKTSLLHIISNSVKSPLARSEEYRDPNCYRIIKNANILMNPKIESLVRDAKYVDPSSGVKGNLFEIEYSDERRIKFRKHNSNKNNRYSIKPYYDGTTGNNYLPSCPVIYLGLSRLFPTAEVIDDNLLKNDRFKLPDEYLEKLKKIYSDLINIDMTNIEIRKISDFKSGPEFVSSIEGIDSNTISSGEDNLFIILKALVSLSYFHDNALEENNSNSILLIDEYDATLHPSLQENLFDIICKYSEEYKIQVFLTTHSLSLLEYAIEDKINVIYLLNNFTDVHLIDEPTIVDIKMHLRSETRDSIYNRKRIPIFMEDDEARFVLEQIFHYFSEYDRSFLNISHFFHLIKCKIGSDNLTTIFDDPCLKETTLRSICILDGDKNGSVDISKCITKLPGDGSPEQLYFEYIEKLYHDDDNSFWRNKNIIRLGYTKNKYVNDIRKDIISIQNEIQEIKSKGHSVKGVERAKNKKVFNHHLEFFRLVILHWLQNEQNKKELLKFVTHLKELFYKVCIPNGIDSTEWNFSI